MTQVEPEVLAGLASYGHGPTRAHTKQVSYNADIFTCIMYDAPLTATRARQRAGHEP